MDDEPEQTVGDEQKTPNEIVEQFSADYPIEVIESPESPRIAEVAALDAELFGAHKALTYGDFKNIIDNGGLILGHINEERRIISEASLILKADLNGQSSLEKALPSWLAYCDGAAVTEKYRGKGLQKQLLLAREEIAINVGKEASSASVRQNNIASIRSMLGVGYVMIADAPHHYGSELEDARVVMLNDFNIGNPFKELDSGHELLETSLKGIVNLEDIQKKLSENLDVISVAVIQGENTVEEYNKAVGMLLRSGYIGVACNDIDVGDSDGERSDSMTFINIDSLSAEIAEPLRLRQKEIQAIVGD